MFSRLVLFLDRCNFNRDLCYKKDSINLLTNLAFRNKSKLKFLQKAKSLYFVYDKKVYFFNCVNSMPYSFFEFFNKSSFFFTNYVSSLSSNLNIKGIYKKFYKFFFRKFRSRRFKC